MNVMTDDAVHSRWSMDKRPLVLHVFVTLQADIFGREDHTVYRPVAERTIVLAFGGRMLMQNCLLRLLRSCRLFCLGRYCNRFSFFGLSVRVGNPIEEKIENFIPRIFVAPRQRP
jgi:hypothetical protein